MKWALENSQIQLIDGTETRSHHPLLTLTRISVYKTPVWWGESSRANCPLIRALEQSARGTQHRQLHFLPALLLVCSTHRAATDTVGGVEWLGKARRESLSTERQESWQVLFSPPAFRGTEKLSLLSEQLQKRNSAKDTTTMYLDTSL